MFVEVTVFDSFNKTPISQYPMYVYDDYEYFLQLYMTLKVIDPSGTEIYTAYVSSEKATGSFTYQIPDGQVGGTYLLKVESSSMQACHRMVRIRDYVREQLSITTVLDKDSYFTGESVTSTVKVSNNDGTSIAKDSMFYDYTVVVGDYSEKGQKKAISYTDGSATFSFTLPQQTDAEYFTLLVTVYYGSY